MGKSKMMRPAAAPEGGRAAALYIRVSTDRQREEGYSIEIQRERLTGYAKSRYPGMELRYYIDDGFTGANLDRPAMGRLIADVKAGEIGVVLVLKLDRLSRSQKDTLYLIEDVFLANHGTAFNSMQESFDTGTAFGRAVVGILSVFAQLERENIYDRTRSGMQKRVELGFWPGGGSAPFGYDYDPAQGILVPNADADTVRRVFGLYLDGFSTQAIAELAGLKYDRLAYNILTRRTYTGAIVYNGAEYRGRHEPIVSEEVFRRVQRTLADRSARHLVSATGHLLTGLLRCGVCGARMRYQKWGKDGFRLVCYSQQRTKPYLIRDPDCDNPRARAETVEEAVIRDVFRFARTLTAAAGEDAGRSAVADILRGEQVRQTAKLRRLYDRYSEAPDDVLLSAIEDARTRLVQLEEKLKLEEERGALVRELDARRTELCGAEAAWPHMTFQEKRAFIRAVIDSITVTGDNIHISYRL